MTSPMTMAHKTYSMLGHQSETRTDSIHRVLLDYQEMGMLKMLMMSITATAMTMTQVSSDQYLTAVPF